MRATTFNSNRSRRSTSALRDRLLDFWASRAAVFRRVDPERAVAVRRSAPALRPCEIRTRVRSAGPPLAVHGGTRKRAHSMRPALALLRRGFLSRARSTSGASAASLRGMQSRARPVRRAPAACRRGPHCCARSARRAPAACHRRTRCRARSARRAPAVCRRGTRFRARSARRATAVSLRGTPSLARRMCPAPAAFLRWIRRCARAVLPASGAACHPETALRSGSAFRSRVSDLPGGGAAGRRAGRRTARPLREAESAGALRPADVHVDGRFLARGPAAAAGGGRSRP